MFQSQMWFNSGVVLWVQGRKDLWWNQSQHIPRIAEPIPCCPVDLVHLWRIVTFLDVDITLINNTRTTSVHIKPINQKEYLHYSSSHPYHTKKAIPFSLPLRGRLNSITFATENSQPTSPGGSSQLRLLSNRVTKQIHRASSHIQPTQTSNTNPNPPSPKPTTFITQFHSKLSKVKQILHSHFHILESDPDKRSVFPTKPRWVFQHPPNLKIILVRTNPSLPPPETGAHACKRTRCRICSIVINYTLSCQFFHAPQIHALYNSQLFSMCRALRGATVILVFILLTCVCVLLSDEEMKSSKYSRFPYL